MASSVSSRKRTRSESDNEFALQSKQFVNEQTVNMNDQTKMKEIHDKTIRMLFQNANAKSIDKTNNNNNETIMETNQPKTKWQQFGDNICLMGDGQINFIDASSEFATKNGPRRCRFCAKQSAIQAVDCINCNLEICEFCGISCMQCNAPLCISCVQLFGCYDNSTDMNACCERCKQIYNIQ